MTETSIGAMDNRRDGPVHEWFSLSYSNYLVLPRSLMQAMPIEWQERMVKCLNQMRDATRHLNVNDNYTVHLRNEQRRFVSDPYSRYRRSQVEDLEYTQ